MSSWLWFTPVTFIVAFVLALVLLKLFGLLSMSVTTPHNSGKGKAYACGEDVKNHRIHPDYSQFFPFAFFFTIMHVLALIIATAPGGSLSATAIALGYGASLVIGLFILFRR